VGATAPEGPGRRRSQQSYQLVGSAGHVVVDDHHVELPGGVQLRLLRAAASIAEGQPVDLGDLAAGLARQDGIRLDYALDANGHPQNIYCRSDHYHYARYGIPIAFFFTGLHGDYHQVTDEPQYIDYPHYARITNYVRDLAVRVADLDHRVAVDKPKPDPNGECRQ